MGAAPNKVALTFDDGPDPEWTPKILDILKEKKAPATFFVIGESANEYDNIVKREYEQGEEIGNHTFTHPDFETIQEIADLEIELNLTELLLESSLGVKTTLFRPPYGIDHQPESASEIQMLPVPQDMGYVIVGARIDPHDWGEVGRREPPPVNDDRSARSQRRGNEQRQHHSDARRRRRPQPHRGGAAADHRRPAREGLRIRFRLGSAGPDARADDAASHAPRMAAGARRRVHLRRVPLLRQGIAFIFIAGILLVSGRALIIGVLALIEKLRPAPLDHPEYQPRVTILIPAYNEESVIVDTVEAALASDYPQLEVLVVDDGSADRTAELVAG